MDAKELDGLCLQWRALKETEADASRQRTELEAYILASDAVTKKERGTVHSIGNEFILSVEYRQKAKGDFALLHDQLPELARPFILQPRYDFSKSGYNQALKHMEFLATADTAWRDELLKLKIAVERNITMVSERPTFSVAPRRNPKKESE